MRPAGADVALKGVMFYDARSALRTAATAAAALWVALASVCAPKQRLWC